MKFGHNVSHARAGWLVRARPKSRSLGATHRPTGGVYADRQAYHRRLAGIDGARRGGQCRRARGHQEARHARRRRQARLQAVRLPRSVGRPHRHRAGSGGGRGEEARRQAGAGAGPLRQPHGVSQSGQDRPDDRHHVGQARPPQSRAGDRAALLFRRRQHPAPEGRTPQELGRPQGQEALRHHGRLLQQGHRPEVRARDRLLRRLGEAAAGAQEQRLHRLPLRPDLHRRQAHRRRLEGRLPHAAARASWRRRGRSP